MIFVLNKNPGLDELRIKYLKISFKTKELSKTV